jgi:hypothetical protein
MTIARFIRKMSSSANWPRWRPSFDFGTGVILSTIRRQGALRPLPSLGSIATRAKGASVGFGFESTNRYRVGRVKSVVLVKKPNLPLGWALTLSRSRTPGGESISFLDESANACSALNCHLGISPHASRHFYCPKARPIPPRLHACDNAVCRALRVTDIGREHRPRIPFVHYRCG